MRDHQLSGPKLTYCTGLIETSFRPPVYYLRAFGRQCIYYRCTEGSKLKCVVQFRWSERPVKGQAYWGPRTPHPKYQGIHDESVRSMVDVTAKETRKSLLYLHQRSECALLPVYNKADTKPAQCRSNVGPASETLDQHCAGTG